MSKYWWQGSDRESLIPDLGQGGLFSELYNSHMGRSAVSISIQELLHMDLLYSFSTVRLGTILQQ